MPARNATDSQIRVRHFSCVPEEKGKSSTSLKNRGETLFIKLQSNKYYRNTEIEMHCYCAFDRAKYVLN